jgi:hypothetical protein
MGDYNNYDLDLGSITTDLIDIFGWESQSPDLIEDYYGWKSQSPDTEITDEEETDITIDGFSLRERLITLEKLAGLPKRDADLEAKHPHLKEMYDAYVNELQKLKVFDRLVTE